MSKVFYVIGMVLCLIYLANAVVSKGAEIWDDLQYESRLTGIEKLSLKEQIKLLDACEAETDNEKGCWDACMNDRHTGKGSWLQADGKTYKEVTYPIIENCFVFKGGEQ